MSNFDWVALSLTLFFLYLFGIYKNRKDKDLDSFILGDQSVPWYRVGFGLMATQASAITFLSAPGQSFSDGMGFVQFYFGLPLAMIVLCISFIPIFHRLKIFTAYEYLETRFDSRVRVFTALLFLIQRGLSTGISIYAPSIILSFVFNWDIIATNVIMGTIIILFTIIGGTKALSYTQMQQMIFVTISLFVVAFLILSYLPNEIGLIDSMKIAGKVNRMKIVDYNFDPQEKYNIWSGLLGGFFLQLSYFGTDQSQVGRYLSGKSIKESRLGLLMNGIIKIPMQFGILLIGILVFTYYQFNPAPIFFNEVEVNKLPKSEEFLQLEKNHNKINDQKVKETWLLHSSINNNDGKNIEIHSKNLLKLDNDSKEIKKEISQMIKKNNPNGDSNDVNYIFIRFILDHLPIGFIGILIAVIFSASMSSVAAAFNSLAATTMIDIVKKTPFQIDNKKKEVRLIKLITVFWGIFCILVANSANQFGSSMIEIVNVLGSWFYGVILGIFLVAFYFKNIGGNAVFWAAVISEILIIIISKLDLIGYLWLNPIGVFLVIFVSFIIEKLFAK